MPVLVGLLRAVNVGGVTVRSADLKAAAESCGFEDVQTYIQSGNVVFRTSLRSAAKVEDALESAIADACDVTCDVIVRTLAELRAVVDGSPFLKRGEDPTMLHVVFLDGTAKATVELDDPERFLPEEVAAVGREVHLFLPNGVGRSKLAEELAKAGRRKGARKGTMRNWRTTTKLLDLFG